MTSFSQSFAPKFAFAVLSVVAVLAGCNPKDGEKEYADAKVAFETGNYPKAVRQLSVSLQYAPENVSSLLLLAKCHIKLGEIAKARESIAMAEALEPNAEDVRFLSGEAAFLAKDYAKAREVYSALAKNGATPQIRSRALASLGIVDIMGINGQKAEVFRANARTHLLEAIRFDGKNAAARYHLGYLYRYSYEYLPLALDQYEIYARIMPASDERVVKVLRGIIPEIKDAIARSAAQRPGADKRDVAYSSAQFKKGDEAWKKNQYKDAKKFYLEAFKADVLNFQAAVALAKACMKADPKNGEAESLKYYMAACSLRPSSKDTLMTAGDLAMKTANYASAVQAYSRAVAVSPNDITAIDSLIRALRKSGNEKAAVADVYQRYRDGIRTVRKN